MISCGRLICFCKRCTVAACSRPSNFRQERKEDFSQKGFTLIELVSVFVVLSLISIVFAVRYYSFIIDSRLRVASGVAASAQSMLSLEYSRRILSGESLDIPSQSVCDKVAISSAGPTVGITCSGMLSDAEIPIAATVDGQTSNTRWTNPQSGS